MSRAHQVSAALSVWWGMDGAAADSSLVPTLVLAGASRSIQVMALASWEGRHRDVCTCHFCFPELPVWVAAAMEHCWLLS